MVSYTIYPFDGGALPTAIAQLWAFLFNQFSSVQFSCSVTSDSLWPHGLQHARPPCPSPTPRVYTNSCPLGQWCHPIISSSVVPFSSPHQSFPALGSLQMSQFFASGGQSIGVSASASVLTMNIQDWFPLGWTCWISLQSKGLSRVFSNTTIQKHQFFSSALFIVQLSHPYMTTGKTIALTRWTFFGKVMSLLFIFLLFVLFLFIFYLFIYFYFILFLNLKHCISFAKHQNEYATGIHVLPILNPPPSSLPFHPSGWSQCTSPKHPVSCIEPGLATRFIHDITHVSMPFSQMQTSSATMKNSVEIP